MILWTVCYDDCDDGAPENRCYDRVCTPLCDYGLDALRRTRYTRGHPPLSPVDFEAPTADLSVEDLKRRYGISKQTLYNRLNAASLRGKRVRGKTFFEPQDVWTLDAVANLAAQGVSLTDVMMQVEAHKQKNADPDLHPSKPEPDIRVVSAPPVNAYSTALPVVPDREVESAVRATALAVLEEREEETRQLARVFVTAVEDYKKEPREDVADPLKTHRLLAEAAREEWVLTGTQLAEVCGVNGSTVTGWRPYTVRCGFWLEAATQGLWTVRKATRDELLQHVEAHARPVPKNPGPGRPRKQQPE